MMEKGNCFFNTRRGMKKQLDSGGEIRQLPEYYRFKVRGSGVRGRGAGVRDIVGWEADGL